MERYSLKDLNEMEVREQNGLKIKSRFISLQNLEGRGDISRNLENIRENFKSSAKSFNSVGTEEADAMF
jgi:hypothetical protein